MKKYFLLVLFLLCGCTSFGKGVASAFLDKKTIDTRSCEVKGSYFKGINHYFSKDEVVKIMMIHGVGSHKAGYSARLQENLVRSSGLDIVSRSPKEVSLLSENNEDIGTLLITHYQSQDSKKEMLFYELTWSKITQKQKDAILYDSSKSYAYKRTEFNQSMKKFLNDTGPDPLIYFSDKKSLILDSFKQANCWMLGYDWAALPSKQKSRCKISSAEQFDNFDNEEFIFITHSLGSKILVDGFEDIVAEIFRVESQHTPDSKEIISTLKDNNFTVFMMANQLPILQIGSVVPSVVDQYDDYCLPTGSNYNKRAFAGVDIVAFSDPNDILSYHIPQGFVDKYVDSRMCPNVINIDINIAKETSVFGIGFVNPLTAHTDYDNDQRIIDLMVNGSHPNDRTNLINDKCEFVVVK